MRNRNEFKALVEERVAAQRQAAVLPARKRRIALRSAVAVILGMIILPVGVHLLGSPDLGGPADADVVTPNENATVPEDGKNPPLLDMIPDGEPAPGLPDLEDGNLDGPVPPGGPEGSGQEGEWDEEFPDAPTAPELLGFSTFNEIEQFVIATNGSADAYAEYVKGLEYSFTASQAAARTIAKHLTSTELPRPANAQSAEDFGCTYYADRVELDLIYRMKGIRYRFVYTYLPSEPHTYEGEPILTDLSLGSATLDLYSGTNCLVGSYQSGKTAVRVIVYTEQAADVDFGQFGFQFIAVQ